MPRRMYGVTHENESRENQRGGGERSITQEVYQVAVGLACVYRLDPPIGLFC
jgi:hypothetical protein